MEDFRRVLMLEEATDSNIEKSNPNPDENSSNINSNNKNSPNKNDRIDRNVEYSDNNIVSASVFLGNHNSTD